MSLAFCRVNTMDPHLLCICVLVYFHACVTLQKLSYPENCTSPRIHHLLHELSPSTLLLQINTHIHTQHPPPGVQQELALGDYREEKKLSGGQSSASLLLQTMGRQKKPAFLPLSPFLAMPAKKLGRAALQNERKAGRQPILLSVYTAKRNGLIQPKLPRSMQGSDRGFGKVKSFLKSSFSDCVTVGLMFSTACVLLSSTYCSRFLVGVYRHYHP